MFLFMFLFMTFYQCFFIMFLNKRIGEIPIIYYVLSHSISQRTRIVFENTITSSIDAYWGNFYYLLYAFSFYSLTSLIFFENMITDSIRSYWENPYYLLCAFSFYSSIFFENTHRLNPLLLGKPLSFTMCFPIGFILFPDGRIVIGETPIIYYVLLHPILRRARFSLKTRLRTQPALTGETPIIYYVLPHRVHSIPRRAHCHWRNLYYLMGASPLDRVIGETSIIYYVLPHPILRRAPWGYPYYLLCASPAGALPLGNPLLFCMCFPIVFFGERIAIGETSTI